MSGPRTRGVELSAKEVAHMSDGEVLECLERLLSMWRWLTFPHPNPSKAPRTPTKRDQILYDATRLAVAQMLRQLSKRIELGRK